MKFMNELVREGSGFIKALDVGNFELSIQASSRHYCEPKEVLDDLTQYTSFEVAVFDKNDNWLNPITDERFAEISNALKYYWEDGNFPVGRFIENKLIQKLYDYCLKISE